MQKLIKKLSENKSMIMGHTVIGYPSIKETEEIVQSLAKSGCEIVEMQMPFSDPSADGPVIMNANDISIKNKTSTKNCMEIMKKLSANVDIPLLFMGYFNTVFNYGVEKFCKDAAASGCQGLIIPDMPIDEEINENFYKNCAKYNLAPILVIAPNTTDERLKKIAKYGKCFVYLMARKGITGEKTRFDKEFEKYINRVQQIIKLPLAVGFGIKEKSQVNLVHKHAQIAVIGSEIINVYEKEKSKGIKKFLQSVIPAPHENCGINSGRNPCLKKLSNRIIMSILDQIIAHKKIEVKNTKKLQPLNGFINKLQKSQRDFKSAISKKSKLSALSSKFCFIAEIKKSSPSEGLIRKDFNHIEIAKIYNKHANAISILTDEKFFQGSLHYLKEISEFSKIPLLRKDFIIDEYQIYEARLYGADAILLIASILDSKQIEKFIDIARSLDMDCLVEIHDEEELEKVLKIKNVEIIGINNRNLKTFKIDLDTTKNLSRRMVGDENFHHLPIIICESGINTKSDIENLSPYVDAFLIGTTFMKAENIEEKIKELLFQN